jgi:hypothetical protein
MFFQENEKKNEMLKWAKACLAITWFPVLAYKTNGAKMSNLEIELLTEWFRDFKIFELSELNEF